MLLCAPSFQLSGDQVVLDLDTQLTERQLHRGVLAFMNIPERAMQPFSGKEALLSFYKPGRRVGVTVFSDLNEACAYGPGLTDVNSISQIASGTLIIPERLYVDLVDLNADPCTFNDPCVFGMASGPSSPRTNTAVASSAASLKKSLTNM